MKQTFFPGVVLLFVLAPINHLDAQICVDPPPGLVSWWPGEGTAEDLIGNNDGTLEGGVAFETGLVGQAFTFDGTGEVMVPHNSSLNVQDFTVDAWVFPTVVDGHVDIILNKESVAENPIEYEIGIRGSDLSGEGTIPEGNLAFFIGGIEGLPDDFRGWVDGGATIPLNTWTHVP